MTKPNELTCPSQAPFCCWATINRMKMIDPNKLEYTIDLLMTVSAKQARLIVWLLLIAGHLTALVLLLLALWVFQAQPSDIAALWLRLHTAIGTARVAGELLGLSALALLVAYGKAMHRIAGARVTRYLFPD